MRIRKSARLLIIDSGSRILLFPLGYKAGHLAGRKIWFTPGGGVDSNETFEEAAQRELFEETGFVLIVGESVLQRNFPYTSLKGEEMMSDEKYFVVLADLADLVTRLLS